MAGKEQPDKNAQELAPSLTLVETTFPSLRPDQIVFSSDSFVLITGSSHPQLAHKIGEELTRLVAAHEPITVAETVTMFTDGERKVVIPTNLRKRDVYAIQSTCPPNVEAAIFETQLMGDAAKRGSAEKRTAIIPYFGYARGDKKDEPRVAISAKVAADNIERYFDRIVTIDIHADQEQGFIDGPWDNLEALKVMAPVLKAELPENIKIVSPDEGGIKRAAKTNKKLHAGGVVSIYKERSKQQTDHTESLALMGDVDECDALIVDDIIGTAGTLMNTIKLLKEKGAKRIFVVATHGIFAGKALDLINNSEIEKVFVTDTIPHRQEVLDCPKIHVVSVAPLIAKAIWCNQTGESISENLLQ